MLPAQTLAEFTPLSPTAQLAIVSLLGVAVALLTIRSLVRRTPPLDSHLTKFEAAIATLTKAVDDLTEAQRSASSHSTRIATLEKECSILRQELDKKLTDQREDFDKKLTAQHEAGDESIHEVYLRIENIELSNSKNFQSIERALGRIEGALQERKK